MRPTTSVAPPGGNGSTSWIGLVGKLSCAEAADGAIATSARPVAANRKRTGEAEGRMGCSLVRIQGDAGASASARCHPNVKLRIESSQCFEHSIAEMAIVGANPERVFPEASRPIHVDSHVLSGPARDRGALLPRSGSHRIGQGCGDQAERRAVGRQPADRQARKRAGHAAVRPARTRARAERRGRTAGRVCEALAAGHRARGGRHPGVARPARRARAARGGRGHRP